MAVMFSNMFKKNADFPKMYQINIYLLSFLQNRQFSYKLKSEFYHVDDKTVSLLH